MSGASARRSAPDPAPTTVAVNELVSAAFELRHALVRRTGLSESELVAMQHLARGDLGPAEIARLLEVSTAASTGIVDRLAQRGHVVRRPHPDDRRRTDVRLTDSGRAEVLAHLRPMLVALAELDAELDEAEREVVTRYLRGAIDAFRRVSGGPGSASGAGGVAPPAGG